MNNNTIRSEILKMQEDEEILICFEKQNIILTASDIKSVQTGYENMIKINDKTFIDCDYVYFMKRRPILEKRVKENVQKEDKA